MANNNAMEMRFVANMQGIERELARLQRLNQRAADRLAQQHQRAAQQAQRAWTQTDFARMMSSQINNISGQLKSFAGVLAAAFAGKEALHAAETWTKFGNSLKVAGLSGGQLKQTQDALYASAIKNGTAIEPLGQLYSRLSQSKKELGATDQQLLKFTDGITAALRVQGGDAEAASGALMQLSQAMSGGIVRAEEFNSINEGARPILEAVAEGWKKAGTSVADLRKIMLDGKLSSAEFFEAFLRGSKMLEDKAAKAPLTVGQAMTNLHTAMTRYIGETNEAYGITERIGQALKWLSENIESVKNSLLIVAGVYGATFIPALARTATAFGLATATTITNTVATVSNTVANIANATALQRLGMVSTAATAAVRGLSAAMAVFGGPVGIAITAIGAALAYLGVSSVTAALETEKLDRQIEALNKRYQEQDDAARKARIETNTMTDAERVALERTAALTGQTDLLSNAYGRLAVEAKKARLEMLQTQAAEARIAAREADKKLKEEETSFRGWSAGSIVAGVVAGPAAASALAPDRTDVQNARERKRLADQNVVRADGELREATFAKVEPVKPAPVTTDGDKKKPKKGPTDRSEAAVDAAEKAYHAALHASAVTMEERHKYQLEALEEEKAAADKEIDKGAKEGTINAKAAADAKALNQQAYDLKVATARREQQEEITARERDIALARNGLDQDALRNQADQLDELARHATSLSEVNRYERQALAKRQEADDAAFKQQQDQLELDRQKAGWTAEEIKRLRTAAEANRNGYKQNENTQLDNTQKAREPKSFGQNFEDYAKSFGTLNEQLTDIAGGAINDLSRGLADAVMGAGSLQEAFSNMAKSMLSQLIELGIRFAIFEALGMAFGKPGLGKQALGIGKNAAGTDSWRGGLTLVGEKGPELINAPRGSEIVPNNLLSRALAKPQQTRSSNGGMIVNNTINANDAVLTDWVSNEIRRATVGAVQASQRLTNRGLQESQANSLTGRR